MSRRSQTRQSPRSRWSILVSGALLALLLGLVCVFWLRSSTPSVATDPGAPGRLVAAAATVDLGRVPFDQLVEARFQLSNTGGGPVRLTGNPKVQMLEGC